MGRRTLIVCTIGPASRKPAVLRALMRAGMDVARLNFSHGDPDEHRATIRMVRSAFRAVGRPVRMFADLPGPKIRVGILRKEPVHLRAGRKVLLTVRNVPGTDRVLPVQYDRLTDSIRKGSLVYLADGFMQLKVVGIPRPGEAMCEVLVGGNLLSKKGLNIPGARMYVDPVTERDLELARVGLSEGVDTFGASFVERPGDIAEIREMARGLGRKARVIAKIERHEALDNFTAILKATDGVMIARGDLGVQVPLERVPFIQKDLITRCNKARKTVITATQMMESMVHSFRPARSDVADVANAVLDGTDAVMLSEETAVGEYPVEAVEWMGRVCQVAEGEASPALRGRRPRWLV
jgi:pyruvate kinase